MENEDDKIKNLDDVNRELEKIQKLLRDEDGSLEREIKNMTPEQRDVFLQQINEMKEMFLGLQNKMSTIRRNFFNKVDKESKLNSLREHTSDHLREFLNQSLDKEDYEICDAIKIVLEERNESL